MLIITAFPPPSKHIHFSSPHPEALRLTRPYRDAPYSAAAAAKSLQSCPTLCDPMDSSPPGSPVPRILQARTLEWIAISFSNTWMWKVKVKWVSHVRLFVTPWTAAHQAPPSMGFSRQEYWSGVPLPSLNRTVSNHKKEYWHMLLTQINLKNIMLSERSQTQTPHVAWFHLSISEMSKTDKASDKQQVRDCPGTGGRGDIRVGRFGPGYQCIWALFLGWWKCSGFVHGDGCTNLWI